MILMEVDQYNSRTQVIRGKEEGEGVFRGARARRRGPRRKWRKQKLTLRMFEKAPQKPTIIFYLII